MVLAYHLICKSDTILVISVISGGPAEKAGLLPFDRIISINDSIFSGKKKNQGEIMKTLRGAKNSTVKLGVQRGNSPELLYFDVTRGDVPVNSVDVSYEAAKGIGYIKVSKSPGILIRVHHGDRQAETSGLYLFRDRLTG